jgi:hypothetical protein
MKRTVTARRSTALLLGLLALLILAAPASAGRRWCAKDPIVTIDGVPVQIWVAVPEEYQAYVNDAVDVKVKSPKGLERKVIFIDEGFNGHGEKVSWGEIKDENPGDGLIPVGIEVKVKFDMKRMEKEIGKQALEADLGKEMQVPVQVTVNIGEVTETFETVVEYGTHKKTRFQVSVATPVAVAE